jgi:hypothetical protein
MADQVPETTGGDDETVPSDAWVEVECGSCGSKQRVRADLPEPRCTSCWLPIYEPRKYTSAEDRQWFEYGCLILVVVGIVSVIVVLVIVAMMLNSLDLKNNAP